MDSKICFNTNKVLRTTPVFPQAVIKGGLVFLSGTTGIITATGKFGETFEEQALQTFENVKTILEEAGSSMGNVLKTTIFMVAGCDSDFKIINKVYSQYFPVNPPVRSAPQVMPFPGGILISMECIAFV